MRKRGNWLLGADILLAVCILIGAAVQTAGKGHETMPTDSAVLTNTQTQQERKKVALTFDDGPDAKYTPILLEGLRERNVKATFFLLGKQVKENPEIVKQMHEDGHEIGCHSFEHVDFSKLSEAKACEQVQKTCKLIYDITGAYPKFVRPPYGEWLPCLDRDFCMVEVLWDVDPLDWSTKNTDRVVRKIVNEVKEYDIILMHDASASSVDAALQVIDTLQKDCYEFVTVDELIFP